MALPTETAQAASAPKAARKQPGRKRTTKRETASVPDVEQTSSGRPEVTGAAATSSSAESPEVAAAGDLAASADPAGAASEGAGAPEEGGAEEAFDVGATFRAHAMIHKLLEQLTAMEVETTDGQTLTSATGATRRLYKALKEALPKDMYRDLVTLAPKPGRGFASLGELRVGLALLDGWLEEVLDQVRGAMASRVAEAVGMEGGASHPMQLMAHMAALKAAAAAGGGVPEGEAPDATGMYL